MLITTSVLILLFSWPFAFPCCKSDAGNRMNDGPWQKYTVGRISDWVFSGLFLLLPPQTRSKKRQKWECAFDSFFGFKQKLVNCKGYQNLTNVLYFFWATRKPQEVKYILVIPYNGAFPPLGTAPVGVSQKQCPVVIYLVSPSST